MKLALPLLLLAGCGTTPHEAAVNDTDPAVTDMLADPIMADPQLALQHGGRSVSVPVSAGIDGESQTHTLGQVAAARVREKDFAGCNAKIDYAFAWMAKLPADLDLPPEATVSEAAGSDAKGCNLRLVRYIVTRPVAEVDAFYRKKGFAFSGSDGVVSAVRASDGATYWVSIRATRSGTSVDFATNRGR